MFPRRALAAGHFELNDWQVIPVTQHWMSLEMKQTCEKCQAKLAADGEAYICSYECSFCPECTRKMKAICPNCGGELVRRPKHKSRDSG